MTPEESKDQEDVLKLGKWDSSENGGSDSPSTPREIYASIEISREDLIEAKKDRLLFGLLKNKKVTKTAYELLAVHSLQLYKMTNFKTYIGYILSI